jgi:hypothetical protein
MRSLFESLLRLYEFDGPAPAGKTSEAQKGNEGRFQEAPEKDTSTFPYLP